MAAERNRVVTLRISDDERAMLDALVERTGLAQSDLMRQCIRQTYRKEFGTPEPPKRRRRKPKP